MNNEYIRISKALSEFNISFEDATLVLNSNGIYQQIKPGSLIDNNAYKVLEEFFKNNGQKDNSSSVMRLNKALRQLNISLDRATEYLLSQGYDIDARPTTKISMEIYNCLLEEFEKDKNKRSAAVKKLSDEQKKPRKRINAEPDKEKRLKNSSPNHSTVTKGKTEDSKFQLSTSIKIDKGQHRLFTVYEHKENMTILLDARTKDTYVYKKIEKRVGQDVIMYIKDIDSFGKCRFEYSVHNDFKKGEKYTFRLVKELENGFIIDRGEYSSFVPTSFSKYFETDNIKLEVDKLDSNKNNLFYLNPASPRDPININNESDPAKLFITGEIYNFKITGSLTGNYGDEIFLVEHKRFKATVKAMDFQLENRPASIACVVNKIDTHKIQISQDRFSLLSSVYRENRSYNFHIDSINIDENSGDEYYLVSDNYGFYHRVFFNEYVIENLDKNVVGEDQDFYLKRIDEKGFLVLHVNTSEHSGTFYSAEQIFAQLDIEGQIDTFFYSFEEILKDKRFKDQAYSFLFEDYRNRENLWIFSYLSFLEHYTIILCAKQLWDEVIDITNIYIALEEWMLEGSDFLNNFSKEKKEITIQKAERKLEQAKFRQEALKIAKEGKSEEFINEINEKLGKTGYLRPNKMGVFKAILKILPELLASNDAEIVSVLTILIKESRLDKYEYSHYGRILEKRLATEKYQLNFNLIKRKHQNFDENTVKNIKDIVQLIALQIYLANESGNSKYAVIKSATLLRYLSFISEDENYKKKLLYGAVHCITSNEAVNLKLEDISNINAICLNIKNTNALLNERSSFNAQLFFNSGGAVYNTNVGWALVPTSQNFYFKNRKHVRLNSNASYFDDKLLIAGIYENLKLTRLQNFREYDQNWKEYYASVNQSDQAVVQNKKLPPVGAMLKLRAKNYLKDKTSLLFVEIIDNQYSGEGVLHIKEVSKVFLNGLDGVINPGEIFEAEVIDVSNGKLSFSLIDLIWNFSEKEELESEHILVGKVAHISNGFAFLLCENGIAASCFSETENYQLEENKCYKFKISHPEESRHRYFSAKFVSESDQHLDEKRIFRGFLEKHIIESTQEEDTDYSSKHNYKLIYELVLVIENILSLEKEPFKKLEYLYLAKFLTSILKHHRSYYFEAQIDFMHQVNDFKNLPVEANFEPRKYVDSQTIESFESLELINDYYKILELFNKEDSFSELAQLKSRTPSREIKRLVNGILAFNLLKEEFPDDEETLKRTKNLIYSHIANERLNAANELLDPLEDQSIKDDKSEEKELNLGLENKVKEFKTSFIYYAGTHSADLEKQSFVIMKVIAGFLNGSGGSVFLGVDDFGNINGLDEDYKHFKNADKYERSIRKYITSNFNKDVNGQIDFQFNQYKGNEYLEIVVPRYDDPIALGNDFYQRQGNETRILTGGDLSMFFKRKFKAA